MSSLSVVLPAYNEEPNIELAVRRALEALDGLADEHELIVVDDGSSDRTGELVRGFLEEHHPRVRLVSHEMNRGYGAALRTGFLHARHGLIFYTDADNQFDIADLEYFLPFADEYDVVVGFRVYRYDPPMRLLLSWVYNRLVRVLFRVPVRDVDCSFKLFRREVLEKITVETPDFFVDTELVAKARKWNFRIVEKGVRHYPRPAGEATVRPSDIPRTLRTILRMWRRIYHPSRGQLDELAAIRERATEGTVEARPTARR